MPASFMLDEAEMETVFLTHICPTVKPISSKRFLVSLPEANKPSERGKLYGSWGLDEDGDN